LRNYPQQCAHFQRNDVKFERSLTSIMILSWFLRLKQIVIPSIAKGDTTKAFTFDVLKSSYIWTRTCPTTWMEKKLKIIFIIIII
jgi:hypothetical protein